MTTEDINKLCKQKMDFVSSSSREMRNRAEKQRRDKLNTYICELAELNPLIANVDKKMDKTSVLRLSAAYLRLHRTVWHCEPVGGTPETGCCVATPAITPSSNTSSSTSTSSGSSDLAIVKASNVVVKTHKAVSNGSNRVSRPNRIYNIDFPVPMDLSEQMLEDMEGFLLILTASGKVVYVSHNVTRVLGHAQNDLMGQSIYNITDPLDHDSLRKNLHPDPLRAEEASTSDTNEERRHRRSFFLKLSQRTTSRAEHTVYELVHVVGQLRVPEHPLEVTATTTPLARKSTRTRDGGADKSHNDCVLVAVVKLAMSCRNELSILDATKDEYVTRHSLDGLIIYSDHRISVVAGYMAEEVCGNSAFTFMHCEDVELTLVSLREMYSSTEGFGTSVYRLIATNGEFIYLRTHGHLEYDETGQKPISFICVNTLMTAEEGEQGRIDMRTRFSAVSKQRDSLFQMMKEKNPSKFSLMDKDRLQQLISNQLSAIDTVKTSRDDMAPDVQYLKCAQYSHCLPPPNIHLAHMETKRRESNMGGSPGSCELSPGASQVSMSRVSPNGSLRTTSICSLSPGEEDSPPNSPVIFSHDTADPMVAGSPTCPVLGEIKRETTSTTTNIITLETSVIRQVSPCVEVRRNGRRGRPPRLNKRSLSPEEDGGGENGKRVCSEPVLQPETSRFWEEELSETNSLLSNTTDFSSIDLTQEEVDDRNSDLQSLVLGELLSSSGLHTTETESLSTNPPSDNNGPAIQDGSSIHRLKSSTQGANVGV